MRPTSRGSISLASANPREAPRILFNYLATEGDRQEFRDAIRLTREIFEIVVRINRERGTTILLVEQNANMALNAADYGYVLENGRIVMEDTCERLREKEDIKEFYLGMKDTGQRGERRWKKKKTWR